MLENRLTRMEDKIDSTLTQALKTNGSVAKAVTDIQNLKQWRTGLTYAYILAVAIILPILAVSLYRLWDSPVITQTDLQSAVNAGVTQAIKQSQK